MTDKQLAMVRSIAKQLHRELRFEVNLNDLINAGVVAVLEAQRSYIPRRPFEYYAAMRARGAMMDEINRQRPLGRRFSRSGFTCVTLHDHHLAASEDAEEALDFARRTQAIMLAVGLLPVEDRHFFVLRYLGGYPLQKISALCGVNTSRVWTSLRSTLDHIRAKTDGTQENLLSDLHC